LVASANRTIVLVVAVLVGIAILIRRDWWPVDAQPQAVTTIKKPSLSQYILSDRYTFGFARLVLVALGFYVIVRIPALILAGRWLKGFGRGGLMADDA
jgi:hypothetical protein